MIKFLTFIFICLSLSGCGALIPQAVKDLDAEIQMKEYYRHQNQEYWNRHYGTDNHKKPPRNMD